MGTVSTDQRFVLCEVGIAGGLGLRGDVWKREIRGQKIGGGSFRVEEERIGMGEWVLTLVHFRAAQSAPLHPELEIVVVVEAAGAASPKVEIDFARDVDGTVFVDDE